MASGSVLLLTISNVPAHSRRSSLSASVSLPGSPAAGPASPASRSRGSLPGQRGRGLGGIGANLGGAESLVVALSGIGDKGVPDVEVSVRTVTSSSIVDPPSRPPAVVFAPLEAHDTLTTPSAICFVSPMGSNWSRPDPAPAQSTPRRPRPVSSIELSGSTSASAVERVVAHVKRVLSEFAGTGIPVIAYTPSTAPLPPQIADVVRSAGCADIISAPFTPESVRAALTKVHPWSMSWPTPQALAKPLEPISLRTVVPPTVRGSSKPSLSLASLPAASTSYQTEPTSANSHMSSLPALAPLVPPPPHLAARASYSCPHIYAPALPPCARRRSVDVGGLALALSGVVGHGGGWGGWAGAEEELTLGVPSPAKGKSKADTPVPKRPYFDPAGSGEAMYAELLSQMYTQTGAAVDGATSDVSSTPSPYPTGRPHSASDPHIPFSYTMDEPAGQTSPTIPPQPRVAKPKSSRPDDVDPVRREELITLLDRWEFEPHKLADADVLACAGLLFEAAFEVEGMEEDVDVRFDQIPPFLRAVRKIYRTQNQYHNFQHALDVFQAVYWFLCRAGVVPPVQILSRNKDSSGARVKGSTKSGAKQNEDGPADKSVNSIGAGVSTTGGKWRRTRVQGRIGVLRNVDVFALLLAAVGHDVGHPGLSNAFMANADTPLSRVFDHKSSLEQLHCALLLRLMHKYGMGHLLSSRPIPGHPRLGIARSNGSGLDAKGAGTNGASLGPGRSGLVSYASSPGLAATYQTHQAIRQPRGFRWLLVQTVLATDMSVHFEWLKGFRAWDANGSSKGADGFSKEVNRLTDDEERLMICQALIKCGDISNPTRPHAVSEHWSKVLLEEWACQATFEQELDLPVTVVKVDVANGAKQQAQGQVNFIDLFTQPLFDATASIIPELHPITEQCALNRKLWQERMETLATNQMTAPPPLSPTPSRPRATSQTQEAHYRSIFPLSLPPALTANMGQNANQLLALGSQQISSAQTTRPSSSGSSSTVGAGSLFSPTGSVSSMNTNVGTTTGPAATGVEPNAVRTAYRTSVRKQKSFHRVTWPAPVAAPPPLPMPSPLRER